MTETGVTKRSKNMAAIRSSNTAIERLVRSKLHSAGFRYRLHRKDLPGKPDLVLPRYRTVVLVNGCFWHGHDCTEGHTPKSNTDYWGPKIAGNVERDTRNRALLEACGWSVLVVRECTVGADTQAILTALLRSREEIEREAGNVR